MTYPTYSHQHLQLKSIARLKQIYSEIGCTTTVRDRRCKDAWISAIADYQARHIQKIASAAPDEQAIAQAELENFIAQQAEAVAPEDLTTVEINRHHHEVYAGKRLIAYISYDNSEFTIQPWVVMVCGEEKFRHAAISQCHRFIDWHHQDGTINPQPSADVPEVPFISEICFYEQEAFADGELVASISFDYESHEDLYWRVMINGQEIFRDTTAPRCHSYVKQQYQQGMLPVQQEAPEQGEFSPLHPVSCPVSSTDNRTMAHIFNECQKYGFSTLNDGIYHNDLKLGQVGYTNGNWWVIQSCSGQPQYSHSVFDAVISLLPVSELTDTEVDNCEQLLDMPFEQLTIEDWQRLKTYEPAPQLVAV